MKRRIHMAQIIMFFYALIIFLSPFLVDRRSFPSSFVSPKSYTSEIRCNADRDCPYELYYETNYLSNSLRRLHFNPLSDGSISLPILRRRISPSLPQPSGDGHQLSFLAVNSHNKEHGLRLPEDPFYEQMAAEFSKYQNSVNVYAFSDKYTDIASLGTLAKYNVGQVYYYPAFQSAIGETS